MPILDESEINKVVNDLANVSVRQRQQIRDAILEWLYDSSDIQDTTGDETEKLRIYRFVVGGDREDWIVLVSAIATALGFVLTAPESQLALLFGGVGSSTACFAAIADVIKWLSKDQVLVYIDIERFVKDNDSLPTVDELQKRWPANEKDTRASALNELLEKGIVQRTVQDKLRLKA